MRFKRDWKPVSGVQQGRELSRVWRSPHSLYPKILFAGFTNLLVCLSLVLPSVAQTRGESPNAAESSPSDTSQESLPFDRVLNPEPSSSPVQPVNIPVLPPGTVVQGENPLENPVVPAAPEVPPEESGQPADSNEPEGFPPNPLEESIENDPLLPRLVVDRPLSPQERSILTAALDELQRQAQAKLQAGDVPGAIDIWNRELRLRRVLGVSEEVDSLSLVGEVAWRENQVTEVRVITQRLQQIQIEVASKTPTDYNLLLKIAQAYQKMRAIDPAVGLYNQILTEAKQQQNRVLEETTLTNLGELHLSWFDFTSAAPVYLELLRLAREQGNRTKEINTLKQLAYIYQQNNQPEQAIATQRQLVSIYESLRQYIEIPPIKMAIGDEYLSINRPDLAAPSYQEAFAVARSGQQYGYAGDALQRLADLYRSLNRLDDALVVYQLLLDVRQQTYDTVGIMHAYDQMGQVYRARGNTPQAIAVFRRGLQLAQQLNYTNKVSYFTTQIQTAAQPPTPQPPAPQPPAPQPSVQQQAPAQEAPVQQVPVQQAPEQLPSQESSVQPLPGQQSPTQPLPTQP